MWRTDHPFMKAPTIYQCSSSVALMTYNGGDPPSFLKVASSYEPQDNFMPTTVTCEPCAVKTADSVVLYLETKVKTKVLTKP